MIKRFDLRRICIDEVEVRGEREFFRIFSPLFFFFLPFFSLNIVVRPYRWDVCRIYVDVNRYVLKDRGFARPHDRNPDATRESLSTVWDTDRTSDCLDSSVAFPFLFFPSNDLILQLMFSVPIGFFIEQQQTCATLLQISSLFTFAQASVSPRHDNCFLPLE